MEIDMFLVYELLDKHPNLELRFESSPLVNGLQIRVVDFSNVRQKYITLSRDQMEQMRGSLPLMDIVKNMINDVMRMEDYA